MIKNNNKNLIHSFYSRFFFYKILDFSISIFFQKRQTIWFIGTPRWHWIPSHCTRATLAASLLVPLLTCRAFFLLFSSQIDPLRAPVRFDHISGWCVRYVRAVCPWYDTLTPTANEKSKTRGYYRLLWIWKLRRNPGLFPTRRVLKT